MNIKHIEWLVIGMVIGAFIGMAVVNEFKECVQPIAKTICYGGRLCPQNSLSR